MASLMGQFFGRYQILEQLGEGGMATVYKAHDTRLERFVAIKVIRTEQFAPAVLDDVMKRFEREAKALAKLSHPNIVHVHDYGEYEGAPYLVMEYVPSGTLKHRADTPMPWQQALQMLLPIARALAYAHEQNIIHRDIKPANILLTEKGIPMLSDFGIAKIVESDQVATLTSAGMIIGTPEYMAPEQWSGESGLQSDIYSLGVVLYELVTGRKPYIADTPIAVMLKQANDPLPYPSQFVPEIPEGLENVLLKALERLPENRFQTMSEFAAALETLAGDQTLSERVKPENIQSDKTLLVPDATGQKVTLAPKLDGAGRRPGAGSTSDVQVSSTGRRQPTAMRRRRWIPIIGLAALLCMGVVAGASLAIRGLGGKNPLSTTTTLVSDPTQVKVLWDTSHGPRTGEDGSLFTPDEMYQSLVQSLANDKFVISNGDLTNLNSYDIVVLSELSGNVPYTDREVDEIDQFIQESGHGLLILSDTPSFENLADIVARRFSIKLGELTSDGPVSLSDEAFFSGVSSVDFLNGGGVFQVSPPAQSAAEDQNGNSVIAFCDCGAGRVIAISDANLWDNDGINQADNQRFAINVFRWLAKLSP